VWSKLRARHYAIILLLAVVTLETSAIAVDRFLSRGQDTAFAIEGKFRNNPFMERFQLAEANAAPLPATLPIQRPGALVSRVSLSKQDMAGVAKPAFAAALPATAALAELNAVQDWLEYTVKKGDSLAQVAGLFGVKSAHLAAANDLTEEKNLKVGQKLRIPLSSSRLVYTVKAGDSLSKIAGRFGVTIQDLITENNLKTYSLTEDQKLTIPLRVQTSALTMVKTETAAPTPLQIIRDNPAAAAPNRAQLAMVPSPNKLQMVGNPSLPTALKIVRAPLPEAPAAAPLAAPAPAPVAAPASAKVQAPAPAPVAAPAPAVRPSLPVAAAPTAPAAQVVPAVAPVAAPAPAERTLAVKATTTTTESIPTGDDEIKIILYTVKDGDNLAKIARDYKTSISQIVSHNALSNGNLKVGQQVKIPVTKRFYRVMQVTSRKTPPRLRFHMPVAGHVTDGYGWRNHPVWRKRLFHAGVDIAACTGSPITAALPGQVVYAGWRSGYGKLIIIRHANGLSTRYGHCSSFTVRRGQMVRAGQMIGRVGSTGVATGPHLHFEIRRNGKTLNPHTLLAGL
jgi:murein DD-endopeptidase MepM/ murein hydrolase activator NlpD